MILQLTPKVVLVYSKMPDDLEALYPETKFIEYQDWASLVREDK